MKIGILGCGRIAQKMGNTLKLMGLSKDCYIASRDILKAKDWKEMKNRFKKAGELIKQIK